MILITIHWLGVVGWLVALVITLGQTVGCWGGRAWRVKGGRPEELSRRGNLKNWRNIKAKGVAKRKSRRVVDDDAVYEIPVITSRNLRSLIMKGGSGGEIKEGLTSTKDWDYFTRKNNNMTTGNRLIAHTLVEREKRNQTIFPSVRCEIIDDTLEIKNEIKTNVKENTYRLLSVKKWRY